MRYSREQYGPALMAYVDAELSARGVSPTAFATEHGMTVAQFGRWRTGQVLPRLDAIVELADALGKPPLELLALTIGAVDEGGKGAPVVTAPPKIGDAIELDPDLTPREREIMRDIWGSFRRFREGGEQEISVPKKAARKGRRKA